MNDASRIKRRADDDFERFWEELRAKGSQIASVVSKDVARALFRGGWFAGGTHTAHQLNVDLATATKVEFAVQPTGVAHP